MLYERVVGERGERRRRVRAVSEGGEGSPLMMRGSSGGGGRIWGQNLERRVERSLGVVDVERAR